MPPATEKVKIFDPEFKSKWRPYILQSLLGAGYILLAFFVMDSFVNGMTVASLGASTFIAFSFPHRDVSRPRYLVGAYTLSAVLGTLFSQLAGLLVDAGISRAPVLCCALVMLVAMFGMVLLDVEHPPAAALAVSLVLSDRPVPMAVAAVLCIVVLSALKRLLLPWLHNL